jgi:5'-nucleotidase
MIGGGHRAANRDKTGQGSQVGATERPRAVITNDDGIASVGLRALARAALDAGLDVVVAAPDGEASGSGAALTAEAGDGQVAVKRAELDGLAGVPAYAVAAAPAFIVLSALRGAFGPAPDLILSGINRGPNTGHVVLHSGTVGAALTGAMRGVRAAAFSLNVRDPAALLHWDTAAGLVPQVLAALRELPPGALLNVNVPNLPAADLRGVRAAGLATRGAVQFSAAVTSDEHLQVTMTETPNAPEPGSDAALLGAGYATVTALTSVAEDHGAALPWPPEADPPAVAAG